MLMRKSVLISVLFILTIASQGLAPHKFYVSMCQIRHKPADHSVELTMKIFTDDLEKALLEFAGKPVHLDNKDLTKEIDGLLKRYLNDHLSISMDDQKVTLQYLGMELDYDVTWCYLEGTAPEAFHKFEIRNDLLTEIFEDQVNIVNIVASGKKKGLLLNREQVSGVVNF